MTKEELLQELLWFARFGESEYALKSDEVILDEIEDYLDSYISTLSLDNKKSIDG